MEKLISLKITQAAILAGGAGTRLKPYTLNNPKPMIPIHGKPFLEHLIELLKKNGIKEILIMTGYLGKKIETYFQDGSKFGIKIKYSHTPFKDSSGEELKSGIRIRNAQDLLNDHFLLLYCDNYWPLNLKKLHQYFDQRRCDLLVTVYSNQDNSTKNNLFVDNEGLIKKYDKSRTEKNLNVVDIGFMIVNNKVIKLLPKTNSKFEDIIFPNLINKNRLAGFLTEHKYYSISDIDRVKKTAKYLKDKKIIFLDRDGVINKKASKANYIKSWDEFSFLSGSIKAIKLLKDNNYKVFIITNQAGIARGLMSQKDLELIHSNMKRVLKKNGIRIDGIYYCPHGWNEDCICRKPKPGMLLQASREHLFDLSKALFIGDDKRDKQTGYNAECKTILVTPKKNLLKIVNSII